MADAPQFVSMDDVQKLVDDQLAQVRKQYDEEKAASDARVDQLQAQLEAAQKSAQPLTSVVAHGGGPGLEIAPTWSQFEQERAVAAANAVGEAARVEAEKANTKGGRAA